MRDAGFREVRAEGHSFTTAALDPETYVAALLPLIEGYVGAREEIGPETAAAWAAEQRELGERDEFYVACEQGWHDTLAGLKTFFEKRGGSATSSDK